MRSQMSAPKRAVFYIHWIVGLTLGIPAAVMGFTGAFLEFEQNIVYWDNGAPLHVTPTGKELPPSEILAKAQAANPNDVVTRLIISANPNEGVGVAVTSTNPGQYAQVENQYTGRVSAVSFDHGGFASRFVLYMEGVHRSLTFKIPGRKRPLYPMPAWAMFYTALGVLLLAFTGLYLRWPKSKRGDWRSWLKINFKLEGYNFLFNLHAVTGTVCLVAFIAISHAGLLNEIEVNRYMHFVAWLTDARPARYRNYDPVKAKASANRSQYDLDLLWPAFLRVVPKYAQATIDFKESTPDTLKIEYLMTYIRNYKGGDSPALNSRVNTVVLDAHTGKVLDQQLFSQRSWIRQFITRNFDVHDGYILGLPGRIYFLLACLLMPLMTVTGWMMYLKRRKRERAAEATRVSPETLIPALEGAPSWLIAYASQTGMAEQLAWQTATAFHSSGLPSRVLPLGRLATTDLRECERALFIVSTHGDGDPPDNARPFVRGLMTGSLPLKQLHCGVLALGDRAFEQFCGFGRRLEGWLKEQGAHLLFDRIEVSNGDTAALEAWRGELRHFARTDDLPDWQFDAPYEPWRIAVRRLLNPGSQGNGAYHIELEPPAGRPLPTWEAGDLVQVVAPGEDKRAREYSIASIPADGRVHLLVRQEVQNDGTLGIASGWLTSLAAVGGLVDLRMHPHHNFRLDDNAARPLILIGNGTGLAGLRAHLKARAAMGATRNWLLFGERSAKYDAFYLEELQIWADQGHLTRVDLVYSRDQPERRYVQHKLREMGNLVREWLQDGAAIYVCGSLEGMAGGVEAVLIEMIGADELDNLTRAGRYRRDVY